MCVFLIFTEVTLPLLISFAQASYVGQIAEGSLVLPPVTLTGVYGVAIQFNLTGGESILNTMFSDE